MVKEILYPLRRSFVLSLILIGIQTLAACNKKSGQEKLELKGKSTAPVSYYFDTPVGVKMISEEQVKGDEFTVEGDIVVRKEWLRTTLNKDSGAKLAYVNMRFNSLWPTMRIAYQINGAPTPDIIIAALAEWSSKTGIQFVARTTEPDYLNFIPQSEGGGRSHMGRIGGGQSVWIGPGCPHGCIAHEIGHALGLWHEHTRPDRDQHITVLMENVNPSYAEEFSTTIPVDLGPSVALGPYDSNSVMHYASRGPCLNNTRPCILRKDGSEIPYDKPVTAIDAIVVTRRMRASDDDASVKQAYVDILNRSSSNEERIAWLNNHFMNGGTLAQMRTTLAAQPQVAHMIVQIYRDILERDPGSSEIASWVGALINNDSIDGIRKAAAVSPEAETKINALYTKILGRLPTSLELQTFRNQLIQGLSFKEMREITIVSDAATQYITKQFTDVLNRNPTDLERLEWQNAQRKGEDTVALRSRLIDGIESQKIISTVYQNIFEKKPSLEIAKKMSDSLRKGTPYAGVREGILEGNQVKKKIVRIINELTGRDATSDKIAEHVLFLKSGKTTLELRNLIAAQAASVTP